MAIERKDGAIILTGETAKNFSAKMKNVNADVSNKRDKFIQDSKENVLVTKKHDKIILTIK